MPPETNVQTSALSPTTNPESDGAVTAIGQTSLTRASLQVIGVAQRASLLGASVFLVWLVTTVYSGGAPLTRPLTIMAVYVDYAGAFLLALGALIPSTLLTVWQRVAAGTVLAALIISFAAIVAARPGYGADTLALSHLAAEATLAGLNPYEQTIDASEIERRFLLPRSALTQLESGGHINGLLSYPALHHLLFVPPLAVGIADLRWVVFASQLACTALLWKVAPPELKLLATLPLLMSADLAISYSAGSTTDWLWVAPLLGTAWAFRQRRLALAGLAFGVACATKQTPWFAAPFLLLWAARLDPASAVRIRPAATFLGAALVAFAAINAPYLAANAAAWVGGVFRPTTEPLVPHGSGFSLLTQSGLLPLDSTAHTLITLGAAAVATLVYSQLPRNLLAAAWIFPIVVIWFHYRSFPNYVIFWLPVVLFTVFLQLHPGNAPAENVAGASLRTSWSRARSWMLPLLASLAAGGVALAAGAPALFQPAHNLDLTVLDVRSGDLDRLNEIELQLTNRGERPIENPAFFVTWESYPNGWAHDGPTLVAPHETARYRLTPPSLEAAPVAVRELDGTLHFPPLAIRVTSPGSVAEVRTVGSQAVSGPPLLNGGFEAWRAPHGWQQVLKPGSGARAQISPQPQGGVALALHREQASPDWSEAGLVQPVDYGACPSIRLISSRNFDYRADAEGWPIAAAGIEVRGQGAAADVAWFVLTPEVEPWRRPAGGPIIHPVAADRALSAVDIPVAERLRSAGVEVPRNGILKVFAAATGEAHEYRLEVSGIQCLP